MDIPNLSRKIEPPTSPPTYTLRVGAEDTTTADLSALIELQDSLSPGVHSTIIDNATDTVVSRGSKSTVPTREWLAYRMGDKLMPGKEPPKGPGDAA